VSNPVFSRIRTEPTRSWKIVHWRFTPQLHLNILHDPQVTPDAKIQVWCNVPRCTFYRMHTRPTGASKILRHCFAPRTHQNALTDQQIALDARKPKFSVTCLIVLFFGSALDPSEHEKWCVNVSRPGRTRTHYVTRRSYRMRKHKFVGIQCQCAFVGIHGGPTRAWKKECQCFAPWTHPNAIRDRQISLDAKIQVWHNILSRAFYVMRTGLTRA
jgi:hypothetical protein